MHCAVTQDEVVLGKPVLGRDCVVDQGGYESLLGQRGLFYATLAEKARGFFLHSKCVHTTGSGFLSSPFLEAEPEPLQSVTCGFGSFKAGLP